MAYYFLADGMQLRTVLSLETDCCEKNLQLPAATHTVFHRFMDNVSIHLLMKLII